MKLNTLRYMLILFLCMAALAITSCIDETLSGDDDKEKVSPVADAGMDRIARPGAVVYLDGGSSRDEDGRVVLYKWQVVSCSWGAPPVLSNVDAMTPVFRVPTGAGEGQTVTLQLTVTDDDGLTATDDIKITVKANLDRVESMAEYKKILHGAYAGIGYGAATQSDDAFLYDVMMEDINNISVDFAIKLMQQLMNDNTQLTRLSLGYTAGVTRTEMNADSSRAYTAKLSLTPKLKNGVYTFTGYIEVDFGEYMYDDRINYSGSDTLELKLNFTGSCTIIYGELSRFIVDTVSIQAYNTLLAEYEDYSVHYNGWTINYNVNDTTNRMLIANSLYFDKSNPGVNNPPDIRDYQVGGLFSIDGISYNYLTGFRYRQAAPATYPGLSGQRSVLSVQGTMAIPGTDRFVDINSLYDAITPLAVCSITRGVADGLWKSGKLTVNGMDMTVEFFSSGDEEIADLSGSSLSETVLNWQTTLDPYR